MVKPVKKNRKRKTVAKDGTFGRDSLTRRFRAGRSRPTDIRIEWSESAVVRLCGRFRGHKNQQLPSDLECGSRQGQGPAIEIPICSNARRP